MTYIPPLYRNVLFFGTRRWIHNYLSLDKDGHYFEEDYDINECSIVNSGSVWDSVYHKSREILYNNEIVFAPHKVQKKM